MELSQSKSLEVGMSVSRGLGIGRRRSTRCAGISEGQRRELARQRESEVEEGHLLAATSTCWWPIPPKYSVAQVIGYMKGKSAIHIAREFAGRSRSFIGQHFWARGYFVSTLGRTRRARFARISGR